MSEIPLILNSPPRLPDEAASQLLGVLYQLAVPSENHNAAELRRHHV
jgi:hypothetical protein